MRNSSFIKTLKYIKILFDFLSFDCVRILVDQNAVLTGGLRCRFGETMQVDLHKESDKQHQIGAFDRVHKMGMERIRKLI